MQVNVLGQWHRRLPDLSATACGVPFNSQFTAPRREELTGELCGECFTEHELELAAAAREKADNAAASFPVSQRTKKDTNR